MGIMGRPIWQGGANGVSSYRFYAVLISKIITLYLWQRGDRSR